FIELYTSAQNLIANRGTGYRKAMSLRGGIYADVAICSLNVSNIWEFGAKRRLYKYRLPRRYAPRNDIA
ncbi:MAG: hypothetical protein IJ453_01625, partial [Oscillospiraceae bacterium]|nr:hypothetical protein [Oscillospiraceae bacterium]